MSKKIVIIGGVAGGATTASQIRKLDKEANIVLFEKSSYTSFGACGMPFYIGEVFDDREKLFAATPQELASRLNITIQIQHEVTRINREVKTVTVRNLHTSQTFEEAYDKLVLAPGAYATIPTINGLDSLPYFTLRHIDEMDQIKDYIEHHRPSKCVIIGGGYVGLEMAENLKNLSIDSTIIERSEHILGIIDEDFAYKVQCHLIEKHIGVLTGEAVSKISNRHIVLKSGKEIETDFIIVATGIKPITKLATEANLTLGETGGIKTNSYMQTDDPSIYALGDAAETFSFITNKPKQVPLSWPAHRQAYIIARHITEEQPIAFKGLLGTTIAKVFDMTVATTGLNERTLNEQNITFKTVYHEGGSHAGYYPNSSKVYLKAHFCPNSAKIYGAQIVGGDGVDKRIDVLATAIYGGIKINDLQEIETCYSPPFSSPKDLVNILGYKAEGILTSKQT